MPNLPSIRIELAPSGGNEPKPLGARVTGLESVSQGKLSLIQEHGHEKVPPDDLTGQQMC